MKVVQLTKVNSDTVEMLRRLLEKAESGELQNIVYCADCTGGHIDTGYTQITELSRRRADCVLSSMTAHSSA